MGEQQGVGGYSWGVGLQDHHKVVVPYAIFSTGSLSPSLPPYHTFLVDPSASAKTTVCAQKGTSVSVCILSSRWEAVQPWLRPAPQWPGRWGGVVLSAALPTCISCPPAPDDCLRCNHPSLAPRPPPLPGRPGTAQHGPCWAQPQAAICICPARAWARSGWLLTVERLQDQTEEGLGSRGRTPGRRGMCGPCSSPVGARLPTATWRQVRV